MGTFLSRFVPPKLAASPEQISAALDRARARLPELELAAADAGTAYAAEAALDPAARRLPAHAGVDLDALRRTASEALAALRSLRDEIGTLEGALPLAIQRRRYDAAHDVATEFNRALGQKKELLTKSTASVIKEAQLVALALEHLHNRRRSLLKLADAIGVPVERGIDSTIRELVDAILGNGVPQFEATSELVRGEIDRTRRKLDAEPLHSAEAELRDRDERQAYRERLERREAAAHAARVERERAEMEAVQRRLPLGSTRHSWLDSPPEPPAEVVEPEPRPLSEAELAQLAEHRQLDEALNAAPVE